MLDDSTLTQINVSEVDFSDRTYIFTFEPLMSQMVQSIRNIGLINLPILAQISSQPKYRIVSGLKRILALIHLRRTTFKAYVLHDIEDNPSLNLFLMNFYENLSIRSLNPIEISIILNKLITIYHVPEQEIVSTYLPLMQLGSHKKVLDMHLPLIKLEDNLKIGVVENFLSQELAVQLLDYTHDERQAVFELFSSLKLGKNRQKEFLRLLSDISHIVQRPLHEIIHQRLIQRILNSEKLTPPVKINKIRDLFRKMRYPIYSEAEEKFNQIIKELKLPPQIVLRHSPYFETDKYFLEIAFRNQKEFNNAQKIISKIAADNKLDKLESLGE